MRDIEAAKLAGLVRRGGNLRLPVNPLATLQLMETTLRAHAQIRRSNPLSGYHDTSVRDDRFSEKLEDHEREMKFRQYVRSFMTAGNTWKETMNFFGLTHQQLREIFKC